MPIGFNCTTSHLLSPQCNSLSINTRLYQCLGSGWSQLWQARWPELIIVQLVQLLVSQGSFNSWYHKAHAVRFSQHFVMSSHFDLSIKTFKHLVYQVKELAHQSSRFQDNASISTWLVIKQSIVEIASVSVGWIHMYQCGIPKETVQLLVSQGSFNSELKI